MKKVTMAISIALVVFLLLLFIFPLVGLLVGDLSPSQKQGIDSFKSFLSSSAIVSYGVIILMAVYWERVVFFLFNGEREREVMLGQKNVVRLCVAVYILLAEGLPRLLGAL